MNSADWSKHKYGLYASFIAGLSSKIYSRVASRVVDMQEGVGYWATCEEHFTNGRKFLYDLGPRLLLPNATIIQTYRDYIQWGYMLYVDALYRLHTENPDRRYLSGWMTPDERHVFAETLTYWALKNADGRGGDAEVMLWTETNTWGTSKAGVTYYPQSQSIPDSFATGLNNLRNGIPPQDVSQIVHRAEDNRNLGEWPPN